MLHLLAQSVSPASDAVHCFSQPLLVRRDHVPVSMNSGAHLLIWRLGLGRAPAVPWLAGVTGKYRRAPNVSSLTSPAGGAGLPKEWSSVDRLVRAMDAAAMLAALAAAPGGGDAMPYGI